MFGVLQSTQDPTTHLSELQEITCFPINHVLLGFLQNSSAFTAAAACDNFHKQVGCDRFPVPDFVFEASCNVPKIKGVRIMQFKLAETNQVATHCH